MTLTDKIIVSVISVAATAFGAYFFFFHFFLSLKVIAIIIGIGYLFFIFMHMALCFPLFFIVMGVSDFIKFNNLFKPIKNVSIILYGLILTLSQMIAISFAYFGVPILFAILFNGSLNMDEAFRTIRHFL